MSEYSSDWDRCITDKTLRGYVRMDCFGRIIIDTCISDEEHLRNAVVKEGDDKSKCRIVLDDLFKPMVGHKGMIYIDRIEFNTEDIND